MFAWDFYAVAATPNPGAANEEATLQSQMTQLRTEPASALAERIEAYIARPTKTLFFDRDLEAQFRAHDVEARAQHAYWAGMIAILAFNVLTMFNVLQRQILAASETRILLASHLTVTIPCVGFVAIVRNSRDPRLNEWLLAAGYMLVTVGALLINRAMTPEMAIFDAFALVLIPVACNIAMPMTFQSSAMTTAASVALCVANGLSRPVFAPALSTLLQVYVFAALLTLVANYRFELAARGNFLRLLRESLRNNDMVRANEVLSEASRTDFLTGTANRRDFDARFAMALESACQRGRPLTVLIADIDHFKLFNDRLGHLEGDRSLKAVAQALSAALDGSGGFAGRFGGEEFAAALPDIGMDAAGAIVERIRANVLAQRIVHLGLGEHRYLTVSIGLASLNPALPEDPASLLRRADAALYRAKRAGRDRAEIDLRVVGA